MALARPRGRPARVPLARSARATRSSGTAAERRSRTSCAPGEAVELESTLVAPRPPGSYRLAFDLVEEFRFWFAGARIRAARPPGGGEAADRRAAARRPRARPVGSRAGRCARSAGGAARHRGRGRRGTPRRRRDSRAGLVAADARRARRGLRGGRAGDRGRVAQQTGDGSRAWAPGGGRNPRFAEPLAPAIAARGARAVEHEGLPAYAGRDGLFEGRAVVRLRSRSGRRTG